MESGKGIRNYWQVAVLSGMDEIPTQDKYENALECDMDLNKKIVKLGELNELSKEDSILLISSSSSADKWSLW